MVKHGGGYLILDVSDNQIDDTGIVMTNEQIDTVDVAIKQKLPILYVGPSVSEDRLIQQGIPTAVFTYAYRDTIGSGQNTITLPMASEFNCDMVPAKVENGHLIPNQV